MITAQEEFDGVTYGKVELTAEGGYHAGTVVTLYLGSDGAPVLQIDTPEETETHEIMRVWFNEDLISGREEDVPASQS